MSIQELETVVSTLTRKEFSAFQSWFEEYSADVWDCQIEQDMRAGRLDAALQRADDHYKAGRRTSL